MQTLTPIEQSAIGREIALGIQERGYHLLDQEKVQVLWPAWVPGEDMESVNRFAHRYGWVARPSGDGLMFRKQDTRVRIAAIWRRMSESRGQATGDRRPGGAS